MNNNIFDISPGLGTIPGIDSIPGTDLGPNIPFIMGSIIFSATVLYRLRNRKARIVNLIGIPCTDVQYFMTNQYIGGPILEHLIHSIAPKVFIVDKYDISGSVFWNLDPLYNKFRMTVVTFLNESPLTYIGVIRDGMGTTGLMRFGDPAYVRENGQWGIWLTIDYDKYMDLRNNNIIVLCNGQDPMINLVTFPTGIIGCYVFIPVDTRANAAGL